MFRPVAPHLNAMSDTSNHTTHDLSDADCIDLLIRHRTNPDVTYDDLAYMAGWIYDATVSPEDLAAIDAGDLRPEISEQLEAILSGEEASAPDFVDSAGEEEKSSAAGSPDDANAEDELSEEEASEDDLREQYEKYQARQQRWYSEQEQLSFDEFVEALWRWENEYGEAWNLEAPDQSDRETLDELEGLICAPPQSRIFSALITTEASKHTASEISDDESLEPEPDPVMMSEDDAPEASTEPTEAEEQEAARPEEVESPEVESSEVDESEAAEADAGQLEEEPTSEAKSPGADSEEVPPPPASGEDVEPKEAASNITEAPSPSTQSNLPTTMSEGKNLVTELRARRNALDSSMAAIRESLKRYEHMREVLDEAISLLDDDSYEQMLRLAKQFRSIGTDASAKDSLTNEASDAEQPDEAVASGDGRSSQQRPFRVTTG